MQGISADESSSTDNHLSDAFAAGWMIADTNGDGVADTILGKIIVPVNPNSSENAAAANWATRLAFGSSGLSLPIVVTSSEAAGDGPRVWIGKSAIPANAWQKLAPMTLELEKGEGAVLVVGKDLAIVGTDDVGLIAAGIAFSARSPYQWEVPGDQFSAITEAVTAAAQGVKVELVGVTYQEGKQGIRRAFLLAAGAVSKASLSEALSSPHLSSVHELILLGGAAPVFAESTNPMTGAPVIPTPPEDSAKSKSAADETEAEEVLHLDLATLYTIKGLFKGSPKAPFPAAFKGHLYVPAGAAGTAMANLSARIGLEGTGITLPLASPIEGLKPEKVKTPVVLRSVSPLAEAVAKKLQEEESASGRVSQTLGPGEGELRIVDNAFKKNGAVLVRGDEFGAVAALNLLSGSFPNLWEPGKQFLSLENIRYELHRFFSLRSAVGQAAVALYHLDKWCKEIDSESKGGPSITDVKAEVYVDLAAPGLNEFVRKAVQQDLHSSHIQISTGSLHAGTQCCQAHPDLHYQSPTHPFHQSAPTFSEDLVIPWEGRRLLQAVSGVASRIKPGQPVTIVARVSEGPQERQKLAGQIEDILTHAGATRAQLHVEVLSAYKPGYSWLMDEIVPELAGKAVGGIRIDFARNIDASEVRGMSTPARWVQELYPVDEMLAQKMNIPLANVTFEEFMPSPTDPTYRVHVTDTSGHEILSSSFRVTTAMQPYNKVMPEYEEVQVDTGWVHLQSGSSVLLDQRIKTDIEEFWDHY
jgi:hypothetical protein